MDTFALRILFVSAFLIAGSAARLSGEGIIGGSKAEPNQFPYQIALYSSGEFICGGGIIGDRHVITAAHCVVDESTNTINRDRLTIVAGLNSLRNTGNAVQVDVEKIYALYEYNPLTGTTKGDISILKLSKSLGLDKNSKLSKLELPEDNKETYTNEEVKIAGFGWDKIQVRYWLNQPMEDGSTSGILKFAVSKVVDNAQCSRLYRGYQTVFSTQICARAEQPENSSGYSGVCSGDSGGPLVHNDKTVVGLVSTSPLGCTEARRPAVYTRVSSYLDFVENALNDEVTSSMRSYSFQQKQTSTTSRPSYWPGSWFPFWN